MTEPVFQRERPTRAYVLHPDLKAQDARRMPEHRLAEAVSLAVALPMLEVVGAEVVRLPKPHAGHLFGTGKLAELKVVEDWLTMNLGMLHLQVRTLEMQKAARAALKP